MARLRTFSFLLMVNSVLFAQPKNREFIQNDGQLILLGQIDRERLMLSPFDQWFKFTYQTYQPVQALIDETIHTIDSIELFMATWCGDSRSEVPKFIKILDEIDFNPDNLRIICVDKGWGNYKKSPGGEEKGKNIHRVPTFIFYKDGIELGRIVETPVRSFEEDILDILNQNYIPYYTVVNDLNSKFQHESIDKIEKDLKKLAIEYRVKVRNSWELSTYSKQLLTSFELQKARLVYDLNALIFPDELHTNFYRGIFYEILGNKKEAIACFSRCLEIQPEHPASLKKLSDLR